eukprot:gene5385-7468_t
MEFNSKESEYHSIVDRRKDILKGYFFDTEIMTWKSPTFKICCYISSTITDTQIERRIILDEVLFALRELAQPHEIEVVFVDLRFGIRQQNIEDHDTWRTCGRCLSWCKTESSGIFFLSLLSDKYGAAILPKYLLKSTLDDFIKTNWNAKGDKEYKEMFREWYHVDENAVPPVYVLSNLRNLWDENYEIFVNKVVPVLIEGLNGVPFDEDRYEGLLVGRSITEWEVISAFQNEGKKTFSGDLLNKTIWSCRRFMNGLQPSEEEDPEGNYCDVRGNSFKNHHLSELKNYLKAVFNSKSIELYENESSSLTVASLKGSAKNHYLAKFRDFIYSTMRQSLQTIIDSKQSWMNDAGGLGLDGKCVTEMLHHYEWAHEKLLGFYGREELVNACLHHITSNNKDNKYGICLAVIGVSGSGKTALLAKVADSIRRNTPSETVVIIRFCGTSPRSNNAASLVRSICQQLELILCLGDRKSIIISKYDHLVKYFHQLLKQYPVILFIDSLDQLTDEDMGRSQLSFLDGVELHEHSRIVVSSLPDEKYENGAWKYLYLCETRLHEANVHRIDIQFDDPCSVAMDMFRSLLKSKSRKLNPIQWAIVEENIRLEPTALYVNLSLMMVERWTSYDVVTSVDFRSALPGGLQPLIIALFDRLKREHGQFMTAAALGFITFSVRGVSDVEMEDLLSLNDKVLKHVFQRNYAVRFPSHVWLKLKNDISSLLVEGEHGCYKWYHRQLREAAAIFFADDELDLHNTMGLYYGNLVEAIQRSQRKISSHELTIDGKSPFDDNSQLNVRRCVEASYHMIQGNMLVEVARELCDFGGICCRIRSGESFSLISHLIDLKRKIEDQSHFENFSDLIRDLDHYLRWLRSDIYFLSQNPIAMLMASASSQPLVSIVRIHSNTILFPTSHNNESKILPKSFVRSKMLGGMSEFDSMMIKLTSRGSSVNSVCFSPDGKKIVSGSSDRTIRIWDVETGESLLLLKGHRCAIWSVCFSPNGKMLASGSDDTTVRLWSVDTGETLAIFAGHTDRVYSVHVSFSPNGRTVLSRSYDGTVKLWDVDTQKSLFTLNGHNGGVNSVCFSPIGGVASSASSDKTIRLWNIDTGLLILVLDGHNGSVYSVCFSPDGEMIASGSSDKTIRVWDINTGQLKSILKGHGDSVITVSFSPDGKTIASASFDRTIRIWEVDTGKLISLLNAHNDKIFSLSYSPDGKRIASGSSDETIKIWNVNMSISEPLFVGHSKSICSISFSPDGRRIVSGSDDESLRIWDIETGELLLMLKGHNDSVTCVCYSPDGRMIVSASGDETIAIWDVETGESISNLNSHSSFVWSVCCSPDGRKIASGSGDESILIWDILDTTEPLLILTGHIGDVNSVSFSPDGRMVASGSSDKTIRIWDVETGKSILVLNGHIGGVNYVSFSPDGSSVISGSADKSARIWNIDINDIFELSEMILIGHTDNINSVSFSPDGMKAVSGSTDKTIRIWDVETGKSLLILNGHLDSVRSVCFSPDGMLLASGSNDKTVRIWNIDSVHHQ